LSPGGAGVLISVDDASGGTSGFKEAGLEGAIRDTTPKAQPPEQPGKKMVHVKVYQQAKCMYMRKDILQT